MLYTFIEKNYKFSPYKYENLLLKDMAKSFSKSNPDVGFIAILEYDPDDDKIEKY